jgi:predicted nucleotidyltransferase
MNSLRFEGSLCHVRSPRLPELLAISCYKLDPEAEMAATRGHEGISEAAATALRLFAVALSAAYGERLGGLVVFGSRARGDATSRSDLDVAVILNEEFIDRYREKMALADIAYEAILETGVEVQPWPLTMAEWRDPANAPNPSLIRAMQRDGRRVDAADTIGHVSLERDAGRADIRSRADSVRFAVANTMIEGGTVLPETEALLERWAKNEIGYKTLIDLILQRFGPGV